MSVDGTGTPIGAPTADSVRVTFDAANEKELVFPAGERTSSILIQAHPDNNDFIYIMFDDGTDQPNSVILQSGDVLGVDLDVSSNPVWAEALDTTDELRAAWTE